MFSNIFETIHRFLRLKVEDFEFLLSLVGPKIAKMDTNMREAITPKERLLNHCVSRHSITKIVKETCACIKEVLHSYVKVMNPMKLPSTQEEWLAVSKRFEERWKFPHAIGAIDGKHVHIVAPRDSGSEYFNYKNFFSIVLMVVVDADYNFMYADAGGKGGISDGGIFKNTRLYQRLENKRMNIPPPEPLQIPYQTEVPYFMLGDKAFAFTEYCIRPYGGNHGPDTAERIFNKKHSTARMPVENSLGILCNRFRVLKGPIHLQPDYAKEVIITTVYLHNFLRSLPTLLNLHSTGFKTEQLCKEIGEAKAPSQVYNLFH
uniref:DDE Tnp4 domain-containing protein n=1 Tax=Anopheles epiroticus TaxID=199890 RepID=A0A182PWM5_9DIPT